MLLYNFARLIKKYYVPYILISKDDGHYNDRGIWLEGELQKKPRKAAIVPYEKKIIFHSGGMITENDRLMVSLAKLPDILSDCQVMYNHCLYNVQAETDYSTYGNFYYYRLKWVSVFDQSSAN